MIQENLAAVHYEARVLAYTCPVDLIISRVRHVQELLVEDDRATRGWPDLAHADMHASEYRHRITGLLRTRADEVTKRACQHMFMTLVVSQTWQQSNRSHEIYISCTR
jgi:hypothetical protein